MQVLIGKQSNKSAVATEFKIMPFTSFGLKPNVETVTSKTINKYGFETDSWVSKISTSGDIAIETKLSSLEFLVENAGFNKTVEAKKKTFKAENKFDGFLTAILDDDEGQSHDIYKGLLINSLKIETAIAAYVNVNVGFIGMDFENKPAAYVNSTATEYIGQPLICRGAQITENGTENTSSIENIDITIENSLEGKGALNSIYNKAIKRNGLRSIKINFGYNEFDKTGYNKALQNLKENSTYTVKVVFEEVGATNKGNKVTFEFHKCKISNVERTNIEAAQGMTKEVIAIYDDENKTPVTITFEEK